MPEPSTISLKLRLHFVKQKTERKLSFGVLCPDISSQGVGKRTETQQLRALRRLSQTVVAVEFTPEQTATVARRQQSFRNPR